jgi:hypothetical protein
VGRRGDERLRATILARGGAASGGNGGFVEVSGKEVLSFLGLVDAGASNGKNGTLLLDPYDHEIDVGNYAAIVAALNNDVDVIVSTDMVNATPGVGNITISHDLNWTGTGILTLAAANDIYINAELHGVNGGLTLSAGNEITPNADGHVNVGRFELLQGHWVQNAGGDALAGFLAADFRITGGSFLRVKDGDGNADGYEIVDVYGLQGIGSSADFLDKLFFLVNNIDATGAATWNDGKGFKPIAGPFVGEFDGQGHTIDGLTIRPNDSITNAIGLFGMIGQSGSDVGHVHHVTFVNATVEANPSLSFGIQSIGILAGINAGEIDHVTVGGTIDTGAKAGVVVGGLVGMNAWISNTNTTLAGSISDSSSSAVITVGDGELCLTTCSVGHNFAGGLVGINPGTIENSFATGNVIVGSNSNAGGLVGANQRLFGTTNDVQPTIQNSYAIGNVSSDGVNVQLGGLVGVNHGDYYDQDNSGWIVDSRASGDVIATAAVNNVDCLVSPTNCQYANVGGLVGMNRGTITGTDPPVIGFYGPAFGSGTYATGAVHVGSNGNAGGLVGYNEGLIEHAKATGAVTGDAGAPGIPGDVGGTTLGGLVGVNLGEIEDSSATGTVGALGVANLTVGGLAGASPGWIYDSWASGAVMAGNYSVAGGLAGESAPFDSVACPNCIRGVAFNNLGWIWESTASGAVTVGDISVAGGLVGFSGSIFDSIADGNVLGGIDSILGGLAGVIPTWTFVEDSIANGSVTGGSNSWIGGFAGVNAGMVFADLTASTPSGSTGAVQGDSNSVIGGFVGLNIGGIFGASPATSSDVTATGTGNIVGGLVGANFGLIMGADAYGDVNASVPDNTVGSLAGANGAIANVMPFQVPGSTFPFGQITSSTGYGTVNYPSSGPQVGSTSLAALPTPPAVLNACNDALCQILKNPALIPSLDIPEDLLGFLIFLSFLDPPPPDNNPPIVLASLDQPGPPGPPPPGPNPPIGPNGTIQNAVPGQPTFTPPPLPRRTVMGLGGETVSGMPPLNETRFVPNQVLLHMNINLPTDQLVAAAQRLGIRILTNDPLTNLGQRLINLQLPPGMTVRQAIRLMEQNSNFPLATINGVYTTTQPAAAAPRGDPAQYTIGKLGLDRAHQVATGRGVTIAVIDSEVDKKHGELQGAVAEELNALGAKEAPHSHGTAMAGAIASRDRLLGVAPDAKILAVRAFGEGANTAEGTTVTIIKGIEWAVSQGAKVINMSFAGPRDPSLERALKAARDRGVVLIAAAGNAGPKSPPLYPAADPNVIAVTATDSRDRIFRGANQGPQVSVAAPGVEILAPAPDAAYQMSTGTSIATAHVSGVVALLLERDPNLKPADVRRILEETATGLGPRGKNTQFGWGLVNPGKALEVVTARVKTSGATVGGR